MATFTITLVDAQTANLTVTDGTRSVTFAAITVSPGATSRVAWTSPSSAAGLPSPCFFTCTYMSGVFGNGQTWKANVSLTDSEGNIATGVGAGHSVTVTLGGSAKGTVSPTTLAIPAAGPATSATQVQYTSVAQGNYTDTLTASSGILTSATASFSR